MGSWLSLVPRKVQIVALGAILAAGALLWAHHAGYESGKIDEQLAGQRAKTEAAEKVRATAGVGVQTAVAAAAPVAAAATALHDSVKIVDTVTVTIAVPAMGNSVSMKQNVEIPAIIVRRILHDSLSLLAKDRVIASQASELQADTTVINDLTEQVKTLTEMKTPVCGAKCKIGLAALKVVVVGETVVQVVRWLKPRH